MLSLSLSLSLSPPSLSLSLSPSPPLSLSEWQQVSSGVQDSSNYSDRSQQRCSLDSFDFSSNPLFNILGIVPSALTPTGYIVTCMFHRFFSSHAQSKYLSINLLSFIFTLWPAGTTKSTSLLVFFFSLLIITMSNLLVGTRWAVCISKYQRILCVSFSWTDSDLCIYHLVVWSKSSLLHCSQSITFPS